jgi:hypothetical protein
MDVWRTNDVESFRGARSVGLYPRRQSNFRDIYQRHERWNVLVCGRNRYDNRIMNCEFKEFEPADDRGWRRVRCACCGFTTAPTPHECSRIIKQAPCACFALGTVVADALASVGITKERFAGWWQEPCNCQERENKLNHIGQKIVAFLKGG